MLLVEDHINTAALDELVARALAEEAGAAMVAGQLIPAQTKGFGRIVVKTPGVIAGLAVAQRVFALLDPSLTFHSLTQDGALIRRGQVAAAITGPMRAILSGERVALNFLQRMSGIATLTRRCVEAVIGTHAVILDACTTAPGLRLTDQWAVRLGGGQSRRAGETELAVINDNHRVIAGGLNAAVDTLRAGLNSRPASIAVEVNTLAQLVEALESGVDWIRLDGMGLTTMRRAVVLTNHRTPLEACGNIPLDAVSAIAATGVDYIAVDALTHSARALDISLELEPSGP